MFVVMIISALYKSCAILSHIRLTETFFSIIQRVYSRKPTEHKCIGHNQIYPQNIIESIKIVASLYVGHWCALD